MWLAGLLVCGWAGAPAQTMTERAERDIVITAPKDAAMTAAMENARQTLPDFFAMQARPALGTVGFAVKVAMPTPRDVEYLWLTSPELIGSVESGAVRGVVANAPAWTRAVREGQVVTDPVSAVADWTDMRRGRAVGNYTGGALMAKESAEEKAAFLRQTGLDCAR